MWIFLHSSIRFIVLILVPFKQFQFFYSVCASCQFFSANQSAYHILSYHVMIWRPTKGLAQSTNCEITSQRVTDVDVGWSIVCWKRLTCRRSCIERKRRRVSWLWATLRVSWLRRKRLAFPRRRCFNRLTWSTVARVRCSTFLTASTSSESSCVYRQQATHQLIRKK